MRVEMEIDDQACVISYIFAEVSAWSAAGPERTADYQLTVRCPDA